MNYLKIDTEDICNGEGLRVSLWLSGCDHHCNGCQNPQTWNSSNGMLFDEYAKNKIFAELSKNHISGITLTGGDPLNKSNLNDVMKLINEIRYYFTQKTIWLYTGYTWEEIYINYLKIDSNFLKRKLIVSKCDVLIDGEYIDSKRDVTLKWRGSSNQRVINIQKSLIENKIILYCD